MMRYMGVLGTAAALLLAGGAVPAQDDGQVGVVESEQGAVESFFYDVWSKVKSMSPGADDAEPAERVTVTAGLRGAEGEDKAMEPYWKGGLAEDPDFRKEVEAYRQALKQGRKGKTEPLAQFLERHGDSDLAPNARFALGLAHADAGNRGQAQKVLETFRQQHPQHPLNDDAKAVLKRIGA